jgi:hypothetical protein
VDCSLPHVLTPRRFGILLAASVLAAFCAIGCGSSPSGSGAVCVGAEQTLASIDPNSSSIYVRGGYVYIGARGAASTLTRVPLVGGATETIGDADVTRYGANDADTVAWLSNGRASSGALVSGNTLQWIGPAHVSGSAALPAGVQGVVDIAVDRANNIFLLANDSKGGNTVWRYSAEHQTFDMLHHNIAGLTGFYEDVDGIAWLGPVKGGNAIFHEAVTGGAPTSSPPLKSSTSGLYLGSANVIGVDAGAVYMIIGPSIYAFDRATGLSSTTIDLSTDSAPGPSSVDFGTIAMDETSFYWIERHRSLGTASIRRTAKSGTGSIETVATVNNLQSLSVGGCSLAYVGGPDSSSWGIVARPK